MTSSDLECLKSNVDQVVEIETLKGEHLLAQVISVFNRESDPDVFLFDLTSDLNEPDSQRTHGFSLPLHEIASVRKHANGGRA